MGVHAGPLILIGGSSGQTGPGVIKYSSFHFCFKGNKFMSDMQGIPAADVG